jgi:hypothetical protein
MSDDNEKIILNMDREIKMWRQLYIDSLCLPETEKMVFSAYLMASPAGIEDLKAWNEQLKCFREKNTQS